MAPFKISVALIRYNFRGHFRAVGSFMEKNCTRNHQFFCYASTVCDYANCYMLNAGGEMGIKSRPRPGISWSAMRKILEQENICDSLKGRVQYFQTSYRGAHDQTSRVAIRIDGKEIFRSDYHDWVKKQYMALCELREGADGEKYRAAFHEEVNHLASNQGGVPSFLSSFYNYHNSSIDKNLASPDPVVRLFAIMDKRVGKRRLAKLLPEVEKQPEWLQVFFKLRLEAEGIASR